VKAALVTGATSGIGRAAAEALSQAGWWVMVAGRDSDRAQRTAAGLAGPSGHVTADLAEDGAPQELVEATLEQAGRLDALVNNAALHSQGTVAELDDADLDTLMSVNLRAAIRLSGLAVAHMRAHGGGTITHIASIEGSQPQYAHSHYCSAKAAILMHARTAALELAPDRIRVNSVHPTNVRTIMIDNPSSARIYRPDLENPTFEDSLPTLAKINMWDEPYLDVEDVANAVLFLASDEARYITGAALPVDLGMSQKYSGA
jgi:NAD(P)-dependent dehydrogenase (short-subunit alcohol dehydrogenase family)